MGTRNRASTYVLAPREHSTPHPPRCADRDTTWSSESRAVISREMQTGSAAHLRPAIRDLPWRLNAMHYLGQNVEAMQHQGISSIVRFASGDDSTIDVVSTPNSVNRSVTSSKCLMFPTDIVSMKQSFPVPR